MEALEPMIWRRARVLGSKQQKRRHGSDGHLSTQIASRYNLSLPAVACALSFIIVLDPLATVIERSHLPARRVTTTTKRIALCCGA
jgi:hypothetical protein